MEMARRFGDAVHARRKALGWTAARLSDACTELGYPVTRVAISKIESNTRAGKVDVAELVVLAKALTVPPVSLLYPDLVDGPVDVLPDESVPSVDALEWFCGEALDGDDARAGAWPVTLARRLRLDRQKLRTVVSHPLVAGSPDAPAALALMQQASADIVNDVRQAREAGLVIRAAEAGLGA